MTGNMAKNEHWVPQCYLKDFTKSRSNKSQPHVVDFETGRQLQTSLRDIASQIDFNRVDLEGVDRDFVETSLGAFETSLGKALDRICNSGGIVDAEDHNLILNFIALLAVRNPGMRENVRRTEEQLMKRIMDLTLATKERYETSFANAARAGALSSEDILPYEQMRDFVNRGEYTLSLSTTRHVQRELRSIDTILPLLGQRKCLIARALPDTGGFITPDRPVILQWPIGQCKVLTCQGLRFVEWKCSSQFRMTSQ